jgi:hypothetical protein
MVKVLIGVRSGSTRRPEKRTTAGSQAHKAAEKRRIGAWYLEKEPLQKHRRHHAKEHRNHKQQPRCQDLLTSSLPLLWIGFRGPIFVRRHELAAFGSLWRLLQGRVARNALSVGCASSGTASPGWFR